MKPLSDEKAEGQCFSKRDWVYAGAVTLAVLVVAGGSVTSGVLSWGDDSFAYISEGISIAEGTFGEQVKVNYQYHPTPIPEEAKDGRLVYAWGYPLVQSLVYRLAGFDYDVIVWYKLPLLLSLALTGGALTLFFRRRFSIRVAAFMAFAFCMGGGFIDHINVLYSDLMFLCLSVLAFLMMECYGYRLLHGRKSFWLGTLYGVVLWMTYETRLSGYTVCAAAFIGHALMLFEHRRTKPGQLALHLLPYVLLAALVLISERLWLAPATPNLSDLKGGVVVENLTLYGSMIAGFLANVTGFPVLALGAILCVFCVAGIAVAGFRQNLYLTVFMLGTLIVDVLLPYHQFLRYLFNILPIILMFAAYGIDFVAKKLLKFGEGGEKGIQLSAAGRVILCAAAVISLALTTVPRLMLDVNNLAHWPEKSIYDVYSPEAREAYRYIRDNLAPDEVVAFAKPRLLYLNTGRMSFRPDVNGREVSQADYYLKRKFDFPDYREVELEGLSPEAVLDNEAFTLFKLK